MRMQLKINLMFKITTNSYQISNIILTGTTIVTETTPSITPSATPSVTEGR